MEQADKEMFRLWRIHKTTHQMVHDRGYMVSQSEMDMSFADFAKTFGPSQSSLDRNRLTFLVQKPTNVRDQLFIFFPEDPTVGVKIIRDYCEKMVEQGVFRAIVVARSSLTPSAQKIMTSMAPKYILEHFLEMELLINITEHELVPPHIPLDAEQHQSLLKKYRLKEIQLPRILTTDPVARYHGFRRGQIIKIIRKSETAGRYVTYRIVV